MKSPIPRSIRQIIQLKNFGANVFFNITTPKFAAQAIKKAAEIGWKPAHYLNNVSSSVGSVMKPAGLENVAGHHHRALPQGPDRQAVGKREGLPGLEGLHGEVHAATATSPMPATCSAIQSPT